MNNFSYFSKALDEVVDARLDDYVETLEVDKRYEFSEKYNKKINKLIKHREKPYFTLICTTGRRVACCVAALLILSFSSLSVKAVREAVCDFFMNIFSDHTEIIADSEIENSYPHSIDEEYHISSLPDGFKQVDYDKMENSIIITYFKDDDYIFFEQYTKDAYLSNYDNEQSTFESYTDENGQEYLVHNTDHDHTFIWDNGKYIFEICSNLDKRSVLELCESTKIK